MRLSPEDGTLLPDATTPSVEERASAIGQLAFDWSAPTAPGLLVDEPDVLPGEGAEQLGPRTSNAVALALAGQLPRSRPTKYYEPQKLSPLHINMIMDRAAGLKPDEIGAKYDLTQARASVILNHPDAVSLYSIMLGESADLMVDPRRRIEGYAHEMIDLKVALVRDPESGPKLRNSIATELLDRAGYGARTQIEIDTKHTIQMPSTFAARLADGLAEAARIREIPYAEYVQLGMAGASAAPVVSGPLDGEGSDVATLSSGTGHPEAIADTSLSTHPAVAPASAQERVA